MGRVELLNAQALNTGERLRTHTPTTMVTSDDFDKTKGHVAQKPRNVIKATQTCRSACQQAFRIHEVPFCGIT